MKKMIFSLTLVCLASATLPLDATAAFVEEHDGSYSSYDDVPDDTPRETDERVPVYAERPDDILLLVPLRTGVRLPSGNATRSGPVVGRQTHVPYQAVARVKGKGGRR